MPWMDDLPAEIADSLSDETKTNSTLAQYNSLEEALKGHINTKAAMGRSIRIPGEDAGETDRKQFLEKLINNAPEVMLKPDFSSPDQSQEFYRTLGLPEEFSQYNNPEDTNVNADVEAQLREVLFAANVTDSQYKKIMKSFSDMEATTKELTDQTFEDQANELKGKWGTTHEERLASAKKMNDEFYPGRDFAALSSGDIESLYNIHISVTGKGPQAPGQPEDPPGMTPTEAREQADEIMRRVHDPESKLNQLEKMALVNKRIAILRKFVPGMDAPA